MQGPCEYDLQTIPDGVWSGADNGLPQPPVIGATVHITFNGLGRGRVVSYFREHGYVGVCVKLADPPVWHVKQKTGKYAGHALVFGTEVMPFVDALPFADEWQPPV